MCNTEPEVQFVPAVGRREQEKCMYELYICRDGHTSHSDALLWQLMHNTDILVHGSECIFFRVPGKGRQSP